MSNLRSGTYGNYYGSFWGESAPLTGSQMKTNAMYIYSALTAKGWTPEAIAGLLGNLENESTINPGRWEGEKVGKGPGYSLVQWTPYTNYTDWCKEKGLSDPSEMDNAIARIIYELENGLQYYATDSYPLSFKKFTQSKNSPYDLACAFAWNYERSWTVLYGTEEEKAALRMLRGGDAEKWYTYITGQEPTPPVTPDPGGGGGGGSVTIKRGTGFKFVLFGRRRKLT